MIRRVAVVLPSGPDGWRVANLSTGFMRGADDLARAGFAVELFAPPGANSPSVASSQIKVTTLTYGDPPILAGPAAGHLSASLRTGHQLWRRLAAEPPDLVLAPLAGGILQPALMSRFLGESLGDTAIVAWGEAGSAARLELGDIEPAGAAAVIDDALETTVLRLADGLAGPNADHRLILPARPPSAAVIRPPAIDEIVLVGPASGRHGTPAFLAAVEQMGHAGKLAARRVTFLGPWREGPNGLGKAMLGRRARNWTFDFTQIDESRPDKILERLCRPGVLPVFAGAAPDDDVILADAVAAGVVTAVCVHHPLAAWLDGAVGLCAPDLSDLVRLLDGEAARAPALPPAPDWPGVIETLIETRRSRRPNIAAPVRSASLCITHRDRPAELAAALASRGAGVGPRLETLIVDTGSAADALESLGVHERPDVRIIAGPLGARQSWARNLAAERASGEVLVFLDDDNLFVDDGLSRLLGAFANSGADVVVPTLTLYDSAPGQGPPAGHLVFMGHAAWAGLLFNAFGDANFAIRRDRFLEIGGFADDDAAAFDWTFFAKAQSRGLTIAVLQRPAVGYLRDIRGGDTKWRKRDLEEPRRHVLGAYDLGQSSTVIMALTQCLSLPLIE